VKKYLGLDKSSFFAPNLDALDEIMRAMGFEITDIEEGSDIVRRYDKDCGDVVKHITIKNELVDKQGRLKGFLKKDILEKNLIYVAASNNDPDLPF
jgi:hypothetical protein